MRLSEKISILMKALKKANKKNIIKKINFIIKAGGLKALKSAVLQTAYRNEIEKNDIQSNRSIYQEQLVNFVEPTDYKASSFLIIIFLTETQNFIQDTINSIRSQMNVTNVKVCLYVDDSVDQIENNYGYKIYKQNETHLNDIIRLNDCDYFMFIKAGNTLVPYALYQFITEMDKGISFTYSDECVYNFETCSITKHYFKPEFSKYYLLNSFYTEQSVCFNSKDIIEIGGFSHKINDASILINEAVLKLVYNGKTTTHIEKILLLRHFHYEKQCSINHKDNLRLLREITDEKFIDVLEYENEFKNYCSTIRSQNFKVSIILASTESAYVVNCLKSIIDNTEYHNYEIVLVTNRYTISLVKLNINQDINIIFHEIDHCNDYSYGCNIAAKYANGEVLVFIQDHIFIKDKSWLDGIMSCFSLEFVGSVSPKILRYDGTIRYAGAIAGGFDLNPHVFVGELNEVIEDFSELAFSSREISILSASCLAVRSNIFSMIGGFDEQETPNKFSNSDISFKIAELGFNNIFCANSIVYSISNDWYDNWFDKKSDKAYLYMLKKWIRKLDYDPYFTKSMQKYVLNKLPYNISLAYNKNFGLKYVEYGMKRNVLLMTHELTLTGAPIALHYAAKALLDNGDFPVIISPRDGNLKDRIVEDGIPVIVDPNIFVDGYWTRIASGFDLVIVCTLACSDAIKYLENADIPTLWWVHEARESYEAGLLKNIIPDEVKDNIHIYCGGDYARKMLYSYRPKYKADLLLYAVPDFSMINNDSIYEIPDIENKLVFSTIGSIMKRKGQDILAKAILGMDANTVKKCRFLFIGKMIDSETYCSVLELKKKYPSEIILIEEVSRDELMYIYKKCDSIICASRDDPMPIFMTEAMMFSKICICSENAGTSSLINDGVNGFIYHNNDASQLRDKIEYVINNSDCLDDIKNNGRKTYEKYFTMQSFSEKLISVIDTIIKKEGR